jgi:hypothetical protein
MEELTLKIHINPWLPGGPWQVTDSNYEPGYPYGSGNSIQDAIDDFIERAIDFYGDFKYTWS